MWIQQAARAGKIDLRKVDGDNNPADLLTKHSISKSSMEMPIEIFDCRFLDGRAASAPKESTGGSSKFIPADADKKRNTSKVEKEIALPHVKWPIGELEGRHPSFNIPETDGFDNGHEREAHRADGTSSAGSGSQVRSGTRC